MTAIIIVANIVNYLLDEAFVIGRWGFPSLGSEGVAYATFFCRVFCLVAILGLSIALWARKPLLKPKLSDFSGINKVISMRLIRLGFPAASQIGLEVMAFNLMTLIVARLGAQQLAAHHIVLSIATFTFMFPMGLAMATSIRVGSHIGVKKFEDASLVGFMGICLGATIMAIFGLSLYFLPEIFVGIFTEDLFVINTSLGIIGLCALFQVVDGVQVVSGGALRGIGDTKTSLYSNLFGFYLIGLPLSIFTCFYLDQGLWGLWLGLAMGLFLVACVNSFIWRKKISELIVKF